MELSAWENEVLEKYNMLDMQSINIYLMRHAETDLNKLKIVQVSCENISNKKILFLYAIILLILTICS